MFVSHDPLGVAVIRPSQDMTDASRHVLRMAVHKLLLECPAAIIIDLFGVVHVPESVQMTMLSLVFEAGQEPATPIGFCTANRQIAHDLIQNGRGMRVFRDVAEARRALTGSFSGTSRLYRPLGSRPDAPSAAADYAAEACLMWGLPAIQAPAHTVAFRLVRMARGPYELNITVSLRSGRQLLVNVRNNSTAANSSWDHRVRTGLSPADEARLLSGGATACGQLITGAAAAWWAILGGNGTA